jgi:hypothetical protein
MIVPWQGLRPRVPPLVGEAPAAWTSWLRRRLGAAGSGARSPNGRNPVAGPEACGAQALRDKIAHLETRQALAG